MNDVMALDKDHAPEQLELSDGESNETMQLEAKREQLLHAINSCQLNTIEERVAWLLNHFPKTRDSDSLAPPAKEFVHFQPAASAAQDNPDDFIPR